MGTNPGSLPLHRGQPLQPRDIQNALESIPSPKGVKSQHGFWLAVWTTGGTLADDEGQVLFLPTSDLLITPESLENLYSFVKTFNVNISFDLNTVFNYGQVTIVGNSDLANGINLEVEQTIREYCEVERISCKTSEELILILQERMDNGVPFNS